MVIAHTENLMPLPASMTAGQGQLIVDSNFSVALAGYQEPRLQAITRRLIARVDRLTGIPLAARPAAGAAKAALIIECRRAGEAVQSPREDESYTLEVSPAQARLVANTPAGVARGTATFLQLIEPGPSGFAVPAVRIEDRPRFAWRGLMIDVARHWMPLEVIKRNLDGMEAVKLNVLHLHLSDDQGFRVESKAFPRLQKLGSDGFYYTQDQIRDIVAYARERGIRIVPEFDIPGHSTALLAAYPNLASAPGPYQIQRHWSIHSPCLDPTRETVYKFLDTFIGEMAKLFPDQYLHIGGDEVNGKQWGRNPRIQAFMRAHGMRTNRQLQAYFTKRVQRIVTKYRKKMIGWDEILSPDLPKDIVVQSWRGPESLAEAARMGFQGILSAGYYLDHMQPAALHYGVDPLGGSAGSLTPELKAKILGGEACMWSEYVSSETIDSRIWPRLAAIAERLWSPANVTDVESMYRRLGFVDRDLDYLGLTHRSNYPIMLERLTGRQPAGDLRTLADALEPVKEYARDVIEHSTQEMPLNRLVDAVRPESMVARDFAEMVAALLAGNQAYAEPVREQLTLWRDQNARLHPLFKSVFLLAEAAPLSEDLAALGAAGLEALQYRASGKRPDSAWANRQSETLAHARTNSAAELQIVVVPPVEKLVNAALQ